MADASDDHALILQVSADNSKMLRSFETSIAKLDGFATIMERRAKTMGTNIEASFAAPNIGKALEKTFDSSRLAVLDAGASRLRVFGSALEPLGGLGIVAAAGITVAAIAFSRLGDASERAIDFAANVDKLSRTMGVSSDFIQKFNFAAHQNDIEVGTADESLKKFNVTVGLVQSGLARKQMVNAFASIGFTPEQLRQYHDVGDLFPVIAQRIGEVSDAAQRAAIAKRLGLEDLIPLLDAGATGFGNLAQKASDLGIVMDSSMIEKAKEAKEKLSELNDVMEARSSIAFANMATTLVAIRTRFLEAQTAALNFMSALTGSGAQAGTHQLQLILGLLGQVSANPALIEMGAKGLAHHDAAPTAQYSNADLGRLIDAKFGPPVKPAFTPPPKLGRGGRGAQTDQTDSLDKSANDAYESGLKALLSAQAALLTDIQLRANAEKAAVDADTTKKLSDLAAQEATIRKSKNDTHKAEQLALLDKAGTEAQNAAAAKKELIDRQAAENVRLKDLELTQAQITGSIDLITQDQSLTYSQKLRAKYALMLVDLTYQQTKIQLEEILSSQTASDADKRTAGIRLQTLNALQPGRVEAAQRSANTGAEKGNSAIDSVLAKQDQLGANSADAQKEIQRQLDAKNISEKTAAQASKQIVADEMSAKLSYYSDFFGSLEGLQSSSNATLHAIGKAAALANAAINIAEGETQALKLPVPFNFIEMAAVAAAGAIQVAKIAGLKDGGWVDGPGGPTDDRVPRMLSNREYVVNAGAAARYGPVLEAINAGRDIASVAGGARAPAAQPTTIGGHSSADVHIHSPTWNITNPNLDLEAALRAQPRALKRTLEAMIANRDLRLPR